jgi:hypothetical protein
MPHLLPEVDADQPWLSNLVDIATRGLLPSPLP